MTKPFRPLLAAETPEDLYILEKLGHFPMAGSYKIDGIRGTNVSPGDRILSRSGKPVPSKFAHDVLAGASRVGMDGELIAARAPREGETLYQAAFSAVMTHNSMEPLIWLVFDLAHCDMPYFQRLKALHDMLEASPSEYIRILEQRVLHNVEDVLKMEQEALDAGHEGLIVRRLDAPYKQGRSTESQGYLVKVARVLTSEAEIEGFEELMHNDNAAKTNEVGYTKRSSHQANLRPSGMLGAFHVRDLKTDVRFKIGTGEGLDHALRKYIWDNQSKFLGRIVVYNYKPYGTAMKPRQPSWKGWRSPEDM